jgi:hypothetical protein
MIRLFYNDGAAEAAGGAVLPNIGKSGSAQDLFFGESGKNDGGNDYLDESEEVEEKKPEEKILETKVEEKQPEKVEETKIEEKAPEVKENKPEQPEKIAEVKDIKAEVPKEKTLEEVLKGKGRNDVLKVLGIPETFIGMLDHFDATGDYQGYIEKMTKDWTKVGDEELMRQTLRADYPELSEEDFQMLYDDEVTNRFKLNSENENEIKLGKIRLSKEAGKLRSQRIEEQKNYKSPEPKADDTAQRQKAEAEKLQKEYDQFVLSVKNDEATKQLSTDKRLVLGSGTEAYKFGVEPETLEAAALDTNQLFKSCYKEDGSLNMAKYYKLANYAFNMDKVEKALIDHGKSLANKEIIETDTNLPKKGGNPAIAKDEMKITRRGNALELLS